MPRQKVAGALFVGSYSDLCQDTDDQRIFWSLKFLILGFVFGRKNLASVPGCIHQGVIQLISHPSCLSTGFIATEIPFCCRSMHH